MWDISTGSKTFVNQYNRKTKQPSLVWLFPGESPPVNFKRSRSTSKQMITVFFASPVMWPLFSSRRGRRCQMVHRQLPAQGLRGLECTLSKQQHPQPAAPPRRCKRPLRFRHSGLLRNQSHSAGHPNSVFPGPIPM